MKHYLPLRILVPGVIFLGGMIVLGTFLLMEWKQEQDHLIDKMTRHVRVVGMIVSGQIEAAIRERDPGGIHNAIQSVQGDVDLVKAAIVGPDNRIISATRIEDIGRPAEGSTFSDLYDLARDSLQSSRTNLRISPENQHFIQAVIPLRTRKDEQSLLPDAEGFLLMEYDTGRQAGYYGYELLTDAGYLATAIATLSFMLWYFFQKRLLKRIQRLRLLTQSIGEGNFSVSIKDEYNDEFSELAHEFELMSRRLEQNTRELAYQALHDNLTGLLNRWGFERRLQALHDRLRYDQNEHAMIYIDMDQFRIINENWGHSAGDELLRQLAQALKEKVFYRDVLARIGGDEFGVLLEDCPQQMVALKAEDFRKTIEDFRFQWQGNSLRVSASLGVVPLSRKMAGMESLFSLADIACYAAKHAGKNRIHVWQEGDQELQRFHGEMRWVNHIHEALEENRFILYAQPIVPTGGDDGRVRYEILVRMRDANGKIVPPGEFLAAAERYHLASRIDRWVIENTLEKLVTRTEYLERLDLCTINLSGLSLSDTSLASFVADLMNRTGPLIPHNICFEITETAAITHLGQAAEFIRNMKALGCRFALDDFGSGVSSFGYLKNLDVDFIKIDGIFVRDMLVDPVDRAVVIAINEIAQKMGLQTIAEFVESDAILEALTGIGVNLAQGYGIARPMPLEDLLASSG